MRTVLLASLLITAACKSDEPLGDPDRPDGGVQIAPDGRILGTTDAGVPDDDGPPDATVELTECQEATLHDDLAWIQDHVFTPACASCHGGTDPEVGLNLDPGRSHANLVNKGTSTVSGWMRVVPGSTTSSYLVVSLGRTPGPEPRDGFMPLNADPLCVGKLEAIERWIAAGAQP